MAKRKSTNAVTGCFRFISASGKNVAAEAVVSGIYDVRLENGVLKLSEDQALYRDQPIQNERYKPVAFQSEHRFYCVDRKLHYDKLKNVFPEWIDNGHNELPQHTLQKEILVDVHGRVLVEPCEQVHHGIQNFVPICSFSYIYPNRLDLS